VTSGVTGGRYEPIPPAPVEYPVEYPAEAPVEDEFFGGGGGKVACCGSGWAMTLPVGAAGPRETEPVTSGERRALFEAYGLEKGESPNRVASELQPANPTAISAMTETCSAGRERDNARKLDMSYPLVRNTYPWVS
jgi:hypothetical protein